MQEKADGQLYEQFSSVKSLEDLGRTDTFHPR